jgi:uncharacterized membrane protein
MNIPLPKWLLGSILVTAFLGFLDAMYLAASHYIGVIPPCYVVGGCEQVTTSSYSLILGIPVALMGVLYYVGVLTATLLYVDKKYPLAIKALQGMTVLGFLFSLWFTYVQGFIIEAWCSYCLFSAFTSTVLFILATIANKKMSKNSLTFEE